MEVSFAGKIIYKSPLNHHYITGWWFQTWWIYFPFHIWDNPPTIDELIFFKMVKTTNQYSWLSWFITIGFMMDISNYLNGTIYIYYINHCWVVHPIAIIHCLSHCWGINHYSIVSIIVIHTIYIYGGFLKWWHPQSSIYRWDFPWSSIQ